MANTHVISSVTTVGDVVTITGTVNGSTASCVASHERIKKEFARGGAAAVKAYVAPLMVAAIQAVVTELPTGTFTA